jgi:serine/threonine-protein kinase
MNPGQTVDGKYFLQRPLGAGALGQLFEARHLGTNRRVALKMMSIADLTRSPERVARFEREVRAAASIDSQYVAQVLDAGRDPASGQPYMVSEYLVGESLETFLRRTGALPVDLALRISAQALMGLARVHEASILHRDIRPANYFLARGDAGEIIVKLLDFGLAKVKVEGEQASLGVTGSLTASPLNMSPEQARGKRDLDVRSDLFSVGIIAFQALTGRTPHEHLRAIGELLMAVAMTEPPDVRTFVPSIAPEVAAVVHGALRIAPADRYPTAAAMLADVRRLLPHGIRLREDQLPEIIDRGQVPPRSR